MTGSHATDYNREHLWDGVEIESQVIEWTGGL